MIDSKESPCAVSQELITLQCLQCGARTTGNFITIVECPRCEALDYHIFASQVPLAVSTDNLLPGAPDNKDVINKIIELVQHKVQPSD